MLLPHNVLCKTILQASCPFRLPAYSRERSSSESEFRLLKESRQARKLSPDIVAYQSTVCVLRLSMNHCDSAEGDLPTAENVACHSTKTSFILTIIKIQSMKEVYSYDKNGTKRATGIQSELE